MLDHEVLVTSADEQGRRVQYVLEELPPLIDSSYLVRASSSRHILQSSQATPQNIKAWMKLAKVIFSKYNEYAGFIVLHGTDTMTFAAAVLSFLFENLSKPIIFTGAQVGHLKLRMFDCRVKRLNLLSTLKTHVIHHISCRSTRSAPTAFPT